MATIILNNEQLRLMQAALELYSRIGILQFERILDHPTIDRLIYNQFTPKKKLEVGDDTMRGKIVEIGKKFIKTKGSWGNGEEIKKWTDIDKIKLSPDWNEIHKTRDILDAQFIKLKRIISGEYYGKGGSLGIHNPDVDVSNREAFDMIQVIRHEFWKANEKRSNVTVDSHVLLWTSQPSIIVKLDETK